MSDHRTEFENICDQWDKACRDGIFADAGKPPVPSPDVYSPEYGRDNFGMSDKMAAHAANSENSSDADYWRDLFQIARGEQAAPRGRSPEPSGKPEVLREGTWPSKGPNPVTVYSQGKDSKYQKSGWFDMKDLGKLIKMKEDLHDLGDKLASNDGKIKFPSKKSESIMKSIDTLQREIDTLSDALTIPREEKR